MDFDKVMELIGVSVIFILGMLLGSVFEQESIKNNFKDLNYLEYSSEAEHMVFKDSVTFTKWDYHYILNGTMKGVK